MRASGHHPDCVVRQSGGGCRGCPPPVPAGCARTPWILCVSVSELAAGLRRRIMAKLDRDLPRCITRSFALVVVAAGGCLAAMRAGVPDEGGGVEGKILVLHAPRIMGERPPRPALRGVAQEWTTPD